MTSNTLRRAVVGLVLVACMTATTPAQAALFGLPVPQVASFSLENLQIMIVSLWEGIFGEGIAVKVSPPPPPFTGGGAGMLIDPQGVS